MSYIKKLTIIGFKKFLNLNITFDKSINIIVGENESGKSTILEAINIVINQMYRNVDKYIVKDMLNSILVENFISNPEIINLPSVKIEIRFELDSSCREPYIYYGENNLNGSGDADYGILFECKFDNESYGDLLEKEIKKGEIPYEYYTMTWTTFQGSSYKVLKSPLNAITIDTSATDTPNSFNYFNKALFNAKYTDDQKMYAKNKFRHDAEIIFDNIGLENIDDNRKFGTNSKKLIFESVISVFDSGIPLENKGSGMENLIKTQIALDKRKSKLDVVMIEEPENHLCHTNLMKMLSTIEERLGESQLIITTHNNMIASRLNLNNAIWIQGENATRLNSVDKDVAKFFVKADDNNFLQILLAKKIILVEGATEYLLLPEFYSRVTESTVEKEGISIISCNGISYRNYLEIADKTNKKIAVITDNDKKETNISEMAAFNESHKAQHIFMDKDIENWTWEVCLYNKNSDIFNSKISIQADAVYKFHGIYYGQVLGKMLNNKVETAYQILTEDLDIEIPQYVKDAIEWIRK